MWLLTNFGAFMPAQHWDLDADGKPLIQVRSRRAADLNALRKRYMHDTLGPNIKMKEADYQFRALCTQYDWAVAMAAIALDIDYVSFKGTVKDDALHSMYMRIWGVILGAFPTGSSYDPRRRRKTPVAGRHWSPAARNPETKLPWWQDANR